MRGQNITRPQRRSSLSIRYPVRGWIICFRPIQTRAIACRHWLSKHRRWVFVINLMMGYVQRGRLHQAGHGVAKHAKRVSCRKAFRHHAAKGRGGKQKGLLAEPFVVAMMRLHHAMFCPPLAESVEPVMKPASSDAKNTTQRPISSGVPRRPTGICGRMRVFKTFSSMAITISVPI